MRLDPSCSPPPTAAGSLAARPGKASGCGGSARAASIRTALQESNVPDDAHSTALRAAAAWHPACSEASRADGCGPMVIHLLLATDDSAAVSTSINVNTADPSWPAWLVEAIHYHGQPSAQRLRDDRIAPQASPG